MKKLILISFIFFALSSNFGWDSRNNIEFIQKENQIDVIISSQHFTSYLHDTDLLKPCLHPVKAPSGEIVTRSYPFKEIEGESNDHPHHTGVYFTYASKGEVNGDSFWNMHDVPPQIRHEKVLEMKEGKNKGNLKTLSYWINSKNQSILEETRIMDFHFSDNEYKIDFTIQLSAIDTTVTFQDTKEGMFAIRVADWLSENTKGTLYKSTGEYLNAEGEKTENNIWGKRSKWVRLEGDKDGKTIGIAIYHHPNSINFPTYWHARGYGCFAANPIGQFDFQKGSEKENPEHRTLTINPEETALFKFRMTIYEGKKSKEEFNKEFENFSKT
ncbi:MAG: PmoA family protein [bacterium]